MDMNGNGAFHVAHPDYSEYVAEMKTYIKQIESESLQRHQPSKRVRFRVGARQEGDVQGVPRDPRDRPRNVGGGEEASSAGNQPGRTSLSPDNLILLFQNVIVPIKPYHSFSIEKGVANYAYDRLFGGCVEGSTRVTIEEPYMNEVYYGTFVSVQTSLPSAGRLEH